MKLLLFVVCVFLSSSLFSQSSGKINSEHTNDVVVSLYPNPASDFINISLKGAIQEGTLKIFTALGSEIYFGDIDNFKKVDLSDFKNNVYILNIYSKEELIQTYRFVVRH
jgi:hypothetical protein